MLICAGLKFKKLNKIVRRRRDAEEYRDNLDAIAVNLFPFLSPDFELLEMAESVCKGNDLEGLDQLNDLAYGIHSLRSAQAFRSPLTLDAAKLEQLPAGLSKEIDKVLQLSIDVRELASKGLALNIPSEMPIEAYVELVRDYQPSITMWVDSVIGSTGNDAGQLGELAKKIGAINNEIDRVKGLKRYVALEASIGFFRNNRALVTTALAASALGIAGSLGGCVAALAASPAVQFAKRKGGLRKCCDQKVSATLGGGHTT